MKECVSRRTFIGGEGIPSRDWYKSRRRENIRSRKWALAN
jgi:hypothetical protein